VRGVRACRGVCWRAVCRSPTGHGEDGDEDVEAERPGELLSGVDEPRCGACVARIDPRELGAVGGTNAIPIPTASIARGSAICERYGMPTAIRLSRATPRRPVAVPHDTSRESGHGPLKREHEHRHR
jgi:hypothetical protein